MRILASDYDGTLYAHGELIGDVLGAVAALRAKDNHFGIVTGRDFSMILPEIKRWPLSVDFLVCINGAAVYNGDMTLLSSHLISEDAIPSILNHPAGLASTHYQVSGLGPLKVMLRAGSMFWDAGIEFQRISLEEAMTAKDVGQISLGFSSVDESSKWTAALNTDLGDVIQAHQNKRMIDITRNGVDKATGIAAAMRAKGWAEADVVTVGDGDNDVPMIKAYHGYTVADASPHVVAAARKQFDNVPQLVEYLLNEER